MAKQLSELIKKIDPTVVAAARAQADQEIFEHGLSMRELNEADSLIKEHQDEIRTAWHQHFPR